MSSSSTYGCRSYSQAGQDIFVLEMLHGKRGGRFLEIGSNSASVNSNSYILEQDFDWRGLMIEYESKYAADYREWRHSPHYISDARIVPYPELLRKYKFPANVDYLQIDLDVDNRSTLDVLEKLDKEVFPSYKFAVVTFEHDFYRGNHFDTRKKSREIFTNNGYQLLFADVMHIGRPFEDWFIHPQLVDCTLPTNHNPQEFTKIIQSLQDRRIKPNAT